MPATTPVLDSTSFPHITDLVRDYLVAALAVLDPAACIRLQAVCRAWQTKIQRLFSHLVVTVIDEPNICRLSTIPESIVVFGTLKARGQPGPHLSNFLPLVQILDFKGTPPRDVMAPIAARASSLQMVRFNEVTRMPHWWDSDECPFHPGITRVIRPSGIKAPNQFTCGWDSPSKQVWLWDEDDMDPMDPDSLLLFRYLPFFSRPEELVIMTMSHQDLEGMEQFALHLISVRKVLDRDTDITVVHELLDVDSFEEIVHREIPHSSSWVFEGFIEFLTHDEYREEVGEEMYALHSMQ